MQSLSSTQLRIVSESSYNKYSIRHYDMTVQHHSMTVQHYDPTVFKYDDSALSALTLSENSL